MVTQLQATEEQGGNVLLVAHAGSLDTCTRQLIGKDPRPVNSLMSIVRKVRKSFLFLMCCICVLIDLQCFVLFLCYCCSHEKAQSHGDQI